MRWMVLVLAMMCAGVAVGQEMKPPPGLVAIDELHLAVQFSLVDAKHLSREPKKGMQRVSIFAGFIPTDGLEKENIVSLDIQLRCNGERIAGPVFGETSPFPALPIRGKSGGDTGILIGSVAYDIPKTTKINDCEVRYMDATTKAATEWVDLETLQK